MGSTTISNFVQDHSMENKLHPAYKNPVTNRLTGRSFEIPAWPVDIDALDFFRVEDVPDFLAPTPALPSHSLKIIPQYAGYLVNLSEFDTIDDFLLKVFSKNSRKNVRAKIRKLENEHNIRYKFYHGEIEKQHYDLLFEKCYALMKERFDQKQIYNRYLLDWGQYHQLFYPRILKGEASIFVIYDGDNPITLTLNFHREDIVYSFIQIFDVDYSIYSMGDVAMHANLQWCLENGVSVWDTSKGATENKLRWCNHQYQFSHHLFYKPKNPKALFRAKYTSFLLILKQWLREKGIIGGRFQLDALYYYTKRKRLNEHEWQANRQH